MESHRQAIVNQVAVEQWLTDAEDQLQNLSGLNHCYQTGGRPYDGKSSRWRSFLKNARKACRLVRQNRCRPTLPTVNRAVNQRLSGFDGVTVQHQSCRKLSKASTMMSASFNHSSTLSSVKCPWIGTTVTWGLNCRSFSAAD